MVKTKTKQIEQKDLKKSSVVPLDKFYLHKDFIRKTYCPQATNEEFEQFLQLGASLQADPRKHEIYFVKFKGGEAFNVLSRNFWRKSAMSEKNYDGHNVFPLFENDTFEKSVDENMKFKFKYDAAPITERGELVGAFAIGRLKGIDMPYMIEVNLKEFIKVRGDGEIMPFWKKPGEGGKLGSEWMITKVCESHMLKLLSYGKFGSAISEDEMDIIKQRQQIDMGEVERFDEDEYPEPVATKSDSEDRVEEGEIMDEKNDEPSNETEEIPDEIPKPFEQQRSEFWKQICDEQGMGGALEMLKKMSDGKIDVPEKIESEQELRAYKAVYRDITKKKNGKLFG